VYLNRAAEQLMQRPRDQTIGKRLWNEVPTLRGSLVENMFHDVLDKHMAVHFEYLSPPSNRWFEIHAHPTQNSGLTVYFSDATDRKLMESNVRADGTASDGNPVRPLNTAKGWVSRCLQTRVPQSKRRPLNHSVRMSWTVS
jgi:hypothetical protein